MRQLHLIATCAASILFASCATELDVRKLEASKNRIGVGYVLPFTQYKVKITWTVVECVKAVQADVATKQAASPGKIKVAAKVELEEGVADDAEQAYVIDPTQLESLLSISAFQMKWQDGRNLFSTINITNEDRTAQVIGKSATGLGKIALAAAALGGDAPEACQEGTMKAFTALKEMEPKLVVASGEIKGAEKLLKAVTEKIAAMGANVPEAAKEELSKAVDSLNKAILKQASLTKEAAELLEELTYARTVYWPETSKIFETANAYSIPPQVLKRWASVDYNDGAQLVKTTGVHLRISRAGSFGFAPGGEMPSTPTTLSVGDPDSGENVKGLRYRMPAQGRVFACAEKPCGDDSPTLYTQLVGPVAQLGYVNVLPVKVRRFGSTIFAAELSPIGALESAGYEQKVAAAENAATAFGDVANAVAPLIEYDAASKTRAQSQELADLEFLKKKRDALKALADDPNADVVASVSSMSAETSLINAQIANLNAQITLAEAKAKLAAIEP